MTSPLEKAFVRALSIPKLVIPTRGADFARWLSVGLPSKLRLDPSPVIEAILDASEGRLVTSIDDATCVRVFGCAINKLPRQQRRVVAVRAGARAGKTTRILALKALHAALVVAMGTLAPGEHGASIIVAPYLREARLVLRVVAGMIAGRKELRACVTNGAKDKIGTSDCITIRRPLDGQCVDIIVAAPDPLVGRGKVIVHCSMDESCFFATGESKVSDAAVLDGVVVRLEASGDAENDELPIAQVFLVSTPWVEGEGALESAMAADFGKHELTLCAQGGTRLLNPSWDPSGELEAYERRRDPEKAAREIDAIPLASGSTHFFPADLLKRCVNENRPDHLPIDLRFEHFAAADFGFRTNSSALGIARLEGRVVRLVYFEERKPRKGAPLVPSEVCDAFGTRCAEHGTFDLLTDYESIEAVREHLAAVYIDPRLAHMQRPGQRGVRITEFNPGSEMEIAFTRVRVAMAEGLIELPNNPRLLAQLASARAVPRPGGKISIQFPTVDGAHADLAIACVMALSRYIDNAYGRKLDALSAVMRGQDVPKVKTAAELKEERDIEMMKRMTRKATTTNEAG